MVAPLLCGEARLSSKKGQEALLALARLYQKMGRYSEAISITREGWITLSAPNNCDHPGSDEFSKEIRKEVEQQWSYPDGNPHPLTEVRNDIQHAGFRINPNVKKWFEDNLKSQLDTWENEINQMLN